MTGGQVVSSMLLAFVVGVGVGMAVWHKVESLKIERLEASRDWWRDRALGNHKSGKYPPNPPEVSR